METGRPPFLELRLELPLGLLFLICFLSYLAGIIVHYQMSDCSPMVTSITESEK